ncbi:MAG TPA: regulatory protein RecX [Steroidobacteraceae bacterium]|nr:regulatory protein RecX [Steroidobacteraceae bacterium]
MRLRAKRAGREPLDPQAAADPRSIRKTALEFLARRDFAAGELARRLEARGYDAACIAPVLEELAGKRFLDEERFIENFISYHAGRGQGPIRISAELRQRSIAAEAIERHLEAVTDWRERARVARRKKFGATIPKDFKTRAKQARFLEYRGFSAEHIRAALEGDAAAED